MRTRAIALLWAVASVVVVVGAVGTTFVDLEGPADLPYGFGFTLLGVGAVTAGAVVCARVPGNAVGPILLCVGRGTRPSAVERRVRRGQRVHQPRSAARG